MADRPRARCLLALGALLLAGCQQNAVFELTLELPPRDGDAFETDVEQNAFVQIRSDDYAFDTGWGRESDRDYHGTRLEDDHQEVHFSVVTTDDERGLRMKVRFCPGNEPEDRFCISQDEASPSARALWYELERPFHLGVRTFWEERIDAVPPPQAPADREPVFVDACAIRAPRCIGGPPGGNYCGDDGETHVCEE